MAKASIERAVVEKLLGKLYPSNENNAATPIKSGSSGAIGFTFNAGEALVILFRTRGDSAKEIAVRRLLAGSLVPFPRIHSTGQATDTLDYLIVEEAKGTVVNDDAAAKVCLQEVMPIFSRISATNHQRRGYGFWDPHTLDAPFSTWKEFMLDITSGDWSACRDQESIRIGQSIIKKYADILPEHNALLHGDMSGGNFFVLNGAVSAVIDWEVSMFGDPLYDYAYMTVFYPDTLSGVLAAIPALPNLDIAHWQKRSLCCRLYPLLKYIRLHYLQGTPKDHARAAYYENILAETIKMEAAI